MEEKELTVFFIVSYNFIVTFLTHKVLLTMHIWIILKILYYQVNFLLLSCVPEIFRSYFLPIIKRTVKLHFKNKRRYLFVSNL